MMIDHWMQFGTFAQKDYFEYPKVGMYKGVIINANMAAYAPAGLAAFLLEKTSSTCYMIDPLTHAFQHNPEVVRNQTGEPKSSVKSLAEAYGEPVASKVGSRPILPEELATDDALYCLVEKCVEYQRRQLKDFIETSDAAKYLDNQALSGPYAIIPPYFYMTETSAEEWLPININSAKYTLEHLREVHQKVFASIVIGQGILVDENIRRMILEEFLSLDVNGYLLWIDDFDEQAASRAELIAFLNLARDLRTHGTREVINLHGGYFSALAAGTMGSGALSGVSHGPEFGEYRSVIPVGGGIPIARYYIPELHTRIRYRDAVRMFNEKNWLETAKTFHENVCDCPECVRTIADDPGNFRLFGESNVKNIRRGGGIVRIDYPKPETKERCLRHYLERKYREFTAASDANPQVLRENLKSGVSKYKDVAGLEGVSHLIKWEKALSQQAQTD